jgi:putative alpha-1,2-mannosidase
MSERIEICGREKYEKLLDRFFGFTHEGDVSARFEGFNNESDMESPYAYAYIGRQDKLCRIISEADKYMFRQYDGGTGRGGLPGNNDSGGLSSCYIWNTLGIFPATGQDLMFIARPKFEKATLSLSCKKTLTIRRVGSGDYPVKAEFNGKICEDLMLCASHMMQGGELVIYTE